VAIDLRRWLRFLAGGLFNTAATYLIYLGLIRFMPYQWAYLVAYALGIVIAYVLNSVLVFRVPLSLKRFTAYPVVYLVQYVIAAGLLAIAVEVLHAPEAIAPLAVLVIMVPLSYLLNRLVLGRSGGNAPQDPSP